MARIGWGGSFMGVPSVLVISQPQGRPPILPSMSLPVKISTTPGMALARVRSMLLMLACACGLRTNTAQVWLACVMSSV